MHLLCHCMSAKAVLCPLGEGGAPSKLGPKTMARLDELIWLMCSRCCTLREKTERQWGLRRVRERQVGRSTSCQLTCRDAP